MLLSADKFRGYTPPRATLPRITGGDDGMKKEWIAAIKKRTPALAYSNFDIAGPLTETILLGNVAIRAGKRLVYDGATGRITNDSDANRLLKRDYRAGWPAHRLRAVCHFV